MRKLHPHPRRVESIDMRRESPVSVYNVVADLLRVFDCLRRVSRRLLRVLTSEARIPVRLREDLEIPIRALRTVLRLDDAVDGLIHGLHVRGTEALENSIDTNTVGLGCGQGGNRPQILWRIHAQPKAVPALGRIV